MPRSGCSALHGVNPNFEKKKQTTNTIGSAVELFQNKVIDLRLIF